jgi:hypothetical protein
MLPSANLYVARCLGSSLARLPPWWNGMQFDFTLAMTEPQTVACAEDQGSGWW